jgi:hypothetical protein
MWITLLALVAQRAQLQGVETLAALQVFQT